MDVPAQGVRKAMSTRSTRNSRNIHSSRPSGGYSSGRSSYQGPQGNRPPQRYADGGKSGNTAPTPKKKSKVPKVILTILLILFLCSQITGLIVSPGRSACREIISQFQTACNNLDVNAMVGCLKPSMTNNLLKLGTAAAGDAALDTVLNLVGSGLDTVGLGSETTVEELFKTIQLEPKRFGFPGKTRCVKCKATFAGMTQYVNIYVTKYYGDAYITKISFLKD